MVRCPVPSATYWVRYQVEDERGGYARGTATAATLVALAAQINEVLDRGGRIQAVGATSPRDLDPREWQVVRALTRGRFEPS